MVHLFSGSDCTLGPCDTEQGSPCGNHGTCTPNLNEFTCDCDAHYHGSKCEKYDPCKFGSNPCENDGICTNKNGIAQCSGPCDTEPVSPCGTHGTCFAFLNDFTCDCDDHWFGENCEKYDPCEYGPNPCENNGVCTNKNGIAHCSGPCDTESVSPCGDHGTCSENLNGFTCDCDDHWHGSNCEKYDPCKYGPNPCEKNDVCTNENGIAVCTSGG